MALYITHVYAWEDTSCIGQLKPQVVYIELTLIQIGDRVHPPPLLTLFKHLHCMSANERWRHTVSLISSGVGGGKARFNRYFAFFVFERT